MSKRKEQKEYQVSFDMKASHEILVKAKSKPDAKKKAFKKLQKRINKISAYNVDIETEFFGKGLF